MLPVVLSQAEILGVEGSALIGNLVVLLRELQALEESIQGILVRDSLGWNRITEQVGGIGKDKRKTAPVRSQADDLHQHGNPVFRLLPVGADPLQGHRDHAPGQPAFVSEDIHTGGTDVLNGTGLWSATRPVISDQAG